MPPLHPLIDLPTLGQIVDYAPLIVEPNATAIDAITAMKQSQSNLPNGSSAVLIVEGSQPIDGILTAQDIVRAIADGIDLTQVKVTEIMTHPVITLSQTPASTIQVAWSLMRQHHIHHLPIVNEQGQCLGLVTQTDLLQCFESLEDAALSLLEPKPSENRLNTRPSDRPLPDLQLSDQNHLEAFFAQSLDGFFFMMLDCPIQWDDTVDQEAVLDYVFSHQRITKVNPAMLAQYNASEQDFIGFTPQDFFAHDLETGRRLWREMFDQGRLHVETLERKLDETAMWIEGDYRCLYDSNGKIIGHFGIQRDISDRKAHTAPS